MNQYIQMKKEDFDKAIDFFKKEISTMRTGRANPSMLDSVRVDAYGVKTPLNGVASVSVQDSKSMIVAPWDKSVLKDVEKAIVDANLGLGVVNDGEKLRLTVPLMTEENRKMMVKKLNEKMEAARISVRQVRDAVKAEIENAEKEKEVSEDDRFRYIKELDENVAGINDQIKELRDEKEKEIMTI